MEIKEQQYEKYKALADQLRAREEGDTVLPEDKPLTLMDLKLSKHFNEGKVNMIK